MPVRGNLMRDGPPGWGNPLPPVKGVGQMTPDKGYQPEYDEYFDVLTKVQDGRVVGRDPMTIPLDLLVASGHPARRTRSVVAAMGDVSLVDGLRRHKDLRRQCMFCAENAAEVRRCAIIDCPIWPYRTGRNPHNPRRGVKPRFGR